MCGICRICNHCSAYIVTMDETVIDQRRKIGRKVKDLRLARDLSQVDLALMVGTDRGQISRIEAGEINAGIDSYIKLAAALGVDLPAMLA